ncbi:MAG: DNA polymerase III subunit delta [Thermodesulfobacteriota bacterium]
MKKKISNRINTQILYSNLDNNVVRPVYFFTGEQTFLTEQVIDRLKKHILINNPELNYSLFHGDTASAADIISLAETYPMFGNKRLIILKNAEKLSTNELKAFEKYFQSPSPFTCLVFQFNNTKGIENRNNENIFLVDTTVDKNNMHSSIREIAADCGHDITNEAILRLRSLLGENLQDIKTEIEKLSLYTAGKKKIDANDVGRITEKIKFGDIFQLLNSIAKKDMTNALRALLDLELKNEDPLSILNMLSWRFRLIWRVKELIEKRFAKEQILKEVKISPGALYYTREQAKNLTFAELRKIMTSLYRVDKKLKTSYLPGHQILTKLVLEMCR